VKVKRAIDRHLSYARFRVKEFEKEFCMNDFQRINVENIRNKNQNYQQPTSILLVFFRYSKMRKYFKIHKAF
jgi:hypothetical protein